MKEAQPGRQFFRLCQHLMHFWLAPVLLLASCRFGSKIYDKNVLQGFSNSSEHRITTNLSEMPEILDLKEALEEAGETSDQLTIDSFKKPASRREALEMCMKEIVLHQRFSEEKIALLRNLHMRPKKYVDLRVRLDHIGFQTWKVYMDAKITLLWDNVLLRWAAYALNHPDNQAVYDAFFKAALESSLANWIKAREGFEHLLEKMQPYSEAEHIFIYFCRSRLLDDQIFKNTWFKDGMTNCSFFYAKLVYLMVEADGLREKFATDLLSVNRTYAWPQEYETLNDRIYTRLTYYFHTEGRSAYNFLTPTAMDASIETSIGFADFKIASEITESDDNDQIFENAFFPKPVLPVKVAKTKAAKPSITKSTCPKSQKRVKKQGHRLKRSAPSFMQEKSEFSSETTTEVYPVSSAVQIKPLNSYNSPTTALSATSNSSALTSGSCPHLLDPETPRFSETSSIASEATTSEKSAILLSETGNIFETDEDDDVFVFDPIIVKEQFEVYRVRDKIIQQKAKEKAATMRLKHLTGSKQRTESSSPSTPTTIVKAMTSVDYCTAFPRAHELFTQNHGSICNSRAKRYRWIFDERVELKEEHKNFLCKLFGLSKQGTLSFNMLCKVFFQIEGPVKLQRNGYFQFSHRFVIDDLTVTPQSAELVPQESPSSYSTGSELVLVSKGKGVHPEHATSRFNSTQAYELFDGAGFDPRFLIPVN